MKHTTLELLVCPVCRTTLDFIGELTGRINNGQLHCPQCKQQFNVLDGIPHFISSETLTGFNRHFAGMYDTFSGVYAAFSKVAFAMIGMTEENGRREITDRLEPNGGRVLEISIGPGTNLPYLMPRPDVGEVFGLDISHGQLQSCKRTLQKNGWDIDLFLGNGEQLPFADETFESVFHVGGINFFNDKKAAIDAMIRVAKPGARILIADETERGAKNYEKYIPGFKKSFGGKREDIKAPVDLLPPDVQEVRLFDVWKGWMYCLEFRKP